MESSLSITRADLLRHIGRKRGWDRDPANWDERQHLDGDDILSMGLRRFYSPPRLPGEPTSHRWSFLRPIHVMTTETAKGDYDLPDDFGGIDGKLYFGSDLVGNGSLTRVGEQWVLAQRQGDSGITGYPKYYATAVLPGDGDEPQRFTLMLTPTPDSEYSLRFQYRVNPYNLTATKTYPLGGQPHSETLIASCMAACDSILGSDEPGKADAEFMALLAGSVAHDRAEMGPRNMGYSHGHGADDGLAAPARATRVLFQDTLWD